jgi:undecaprenyl-diphosphatase
LDFIRHVDKALFLLFNREAANPIFDKMMPFITDSDNWIIPIIVIWLYLMIFCGKKGRIAGLFIILAISLSNTMSEMIKHWIQRDRPCPPGYFIEGGRFLLKNKSSFSFPSSHAANMGAMATYFSMKFIRSRWIVIPIALLIGCSRVYVGVHFPVDVLAGYLLGIACGWFVLKSERWAGPAWKIVRNRRRFPHRSLKKNISRG